MVQTELSTSFETKQHRNSAIYKVMAANCEAQYTPDVEVVGRASKALESLLMML